MSSPRRILVVDDEAKTRDAIVRILARHGYEAIGAADGEEAILLLEREPFDLVLSDVQMPKRDGFEVLRFVRWSQPTTHVILMSGESGLFSRAGSPPGPCTVLLKPFGWSQLDAALRGLPCLGRRHAPLDV